MRIRRSEIELGDLITAAIELNPESEQHMLQMAHCLGFGVKPLDESNLSHYRNPQIAGSAQRPFIPEQPDLKIPDFQPQPRMPPAPEVPPDDRGKILELIAEPMEPVPVASERSIPWPDARLGPYKRPTTPSLPRQPLFSTNKARGILLPVVSRVLPSAKPDVSRIIQHVIKQKPLRKIPRLDQRNTRNGCQLLLDFSDSLIPLWPDMRELKSQFHRLLDDDSCPVFTFKRDPVNAFRRQDGKTQGWSPVPGKPVVVASDLGQLAGDSGDIKLAEAGWLRFAEFCHANDVPVIAVVPANPFRQDLRFLSQRIKIVPWNPLTTATAVTRLMAETQ